MILNSYVFNFHMWNNLDAVVILALLVFFNVVLFGCIEQNIEQKSQDNLSTLQQKTQQACTLSQVIKHNTKTDCWTIIKAKVYDITTYIEEHPGGEPNILRACGVDATSLFETKPTGKPHSENAKDVLQSFYKCDLAQY